MSKRLALDDPVELAWGAGLIRAALERRRAREKTDVPDLWPDFEWYRELRQDREDDNERNQHE